MPKPTTGPGRSRNSRPPSSRPLGPRPSKVPSAAKSPFRRKLEQYSARPLLFVGRLPKLVPPLLVLVLLLAGLFAPGAWAGIFLLIVGILIGWLLLLSWPAIAGSAKLVRLLMVLVIFGAAVWRFTGQG